MKRLLVAVLLIAATAAFGDDPVDAAKAAKAKRRKSTTKVITNADVKKAKGTLIENKPPDVPVAPLPAESSLEKQARERKERIASDVKLTAAQKAVTQYEKELDTLAHKYYEENDLDFRDREIVRRFNEVRAKLDAARKDLEALLPPAAPLNSSTAQ